MTDDGELLTVGIGASAGGIKALKRFFEHVPADSGIAYVVILHLSPDHDSRLAEVLQVSARIPVTQVHERVRVEPDHVYVVPPNQGLSMIDGQLALSPITGVEERRAPVDVFFRTLADSQKANAVSVVLSGTGANGSMGVKRVKEQGGVCFAQDPDEAEYADMPRHSIATGLLDEVLPVAEIPGRIISYKIARGPIERRLLHEAVDEHSLREIFSILRSRTGHDFSNYKRATVLRRLQRRLSLHQLTDLEAYVRWLRDHADESQGLLKDLLISVTHFFRDREAFATLEAKVIPKLFEGKGEDSQVRVWVAGCATGEEAYSLAMLLSERASGAPGSPMVQVFATDIDEDAIGSAREGLYTLNDAADVSPDRLRRFFMKEGDGYRVRKELREMVLFARHNLMKDPPFSHLDLVSCRNLLIYLNRIAQQRVLGIVHFAVNPGRYLFLGSSESVDGAGDLFVSVDRDAHLFQSRAAAARAGLPIRDLSVGAPAHAGPTARRGADEPMLDRQSFGDLHHRLLEQYAPPSIVVNEEHEIVHISGRAGRYLQFAGGEPSHNLLKAIRPELRLDLRTALYQAAQQRTNVEARGLITHIDERPATINLLVRPVLQDGDTARGFFLVLFEEASDGRPEAPPATPLSSGDTALQLEQELIRVKSHLRTSLERLEIQAEELTASNEELQAMNEQLRSSAEELETGKEELQSMNEELQTVNQELKIKIDEQTQANNDIQNLMNSTEIGTVFLDRSSAIKLFTPRARDIFNLIESDLGRPLSDISSSLVNADLHADINQVLERLERVEREVEARDGRWHYMRVLPYRTAENRIDGVVITFLDITERKQLQEARRRTEDRLRLVLEEVTDYAVFTIDTEGVIDTWNATAAHTFGYSEAEAIGQNVQILFTPEDRERGVPGMERRLALEKGKAADGWYVRKDGSRVLVTGSMSPLKDADDRTIGHVTVARELGDDRAAEGTERHSRHELEARVRDRTEQLAGMNAALESKLTALTRGEERIRDLLRRLVNVQEDERRRIARDLHDRLGQQLTALRLKLESVATASGVTDEIRQRLEDTQELTARVDSDLDFLMWELRANVVEDLGLRIGVGNFVQEWSKNYGIPAEFHTRGLDERRLGFDVETNLYRIAQEALNNVTKHAAAKHVGVILERRGADVVLIIEDDGRGFDIEEATANDARGRGLGLVGMRERAALVQGRIEIETGAGAGTTIFVQVPATFDGVTSRE
jgi:two-component system CheB/CheR fusion protein